VINEDGGIFAVVLKTLLVGISHENIDAISPWVNHHDDHHHRLLLLLNAVSIASLTSAFFVVHQHIIISTPFSKMSLGERGRERERHFLHLQ
jgi:hypothetical protein